MNSSELPPTQKGRKYEIRRGGLREFAGLRTSEQPLDPFKLAKYAKLLVVPYEQIEPALTEETKKHLIGEGKDMWSGGAASQPLPDGRKLIILNPTHGRNRHQRDTDGRGVSRFSRTQTEPAGDRTPRQARKYRRPRL